jgi:hypothetical protein
MAIQSPSLMNKGWGSTPPSQVRGNTRL